MKYYLISFIPDGGKISLFSPDFPEFDSCGDDVNDAMYMASDCLRICVEEYCKEGRTLPEPCDVQTARERTTSALDEIGFVPEGEISYHYVPVVVPSNDQVTKISVSMTKADLEEIDYKAHLLGMPRSKFIVAATKGYALGHAHQ